MSTTSSSHRKLRLLVASTGPRDSSWVSTIVIRLSLNPQIEMRAIMDNPLPRLTQTIIVMPNAHLSDSRHMPEDADFYRQQAYELVEWADLLVCAPLDADALAKMIAGFADTLLGEVLRGWDASKDMVLVPGMSTHMWTNPITKRQLSKIARKWRWARVTTPILWHYADSQAPRRVPSWNGFDDVLGMIQHHVELLHLGCDPEMIPMKTISPRPSNKTKARLPLEIWTLILDYAGDWEIAKALGIYTNLPMPVAWKSLAPRPHDALSVYKHDLAWTTLSCDTTAICRKVSHSPRKFDQLPAIVVRLIIRFSLVEVLQYLELNRPDLFKAFNGATLPNMASACYPRIDILNCWRSSKFFADDLVYEAETLNGASANAYVHVLDWWWRCSGLPLRYTEAALELASANGHIEVLEWWRDASALDPKVVLRPGRALLSAARYGQVSVLEWWHASGLALAHVNDVASTASHYGHVSVLEAWRQLKGDDGMPFDEQVLTSATREGQIQVLEWWRRFAHGQLGGMEGHQQPVVFRTSAVEAALAVCRGDEQRVRRWWARNGLDSGLEREERNMMRNL